VPLPKARQWGSNHRLGVGAFFHENGCGVPCHGDKCFKRARNTYMDEVRETYLQLAQFWLDVASKLDGRPGSKV